MPRVSRVPKQKLKSDRATRKKCKKKWILIVNKKTDKTLLNDFNAAHRTY